MTAAFKKMDVLFMACRNNIPDLFNDIVAGSRIHSSDHKRHFHLASTLQKAKKIAHTCGELYHCHRKELLQEIINKRVPHLADKFWEKHHEATLRNISFSFDDLVNMVETWAIIQRSKGVEEIQSTGHCNICSSTHATEECHQLLALEVDDRIRKLAFHRLCFHCMSVGHSAKGCVNRPICQICKKQHATILHGRTYHKKNDDEEVKRGGEKLSEDSADITINGSQA